MPGEEGPSSFQSRLGAEPGSHTQQAQCLPGWAMTGAGTDQPSTPGVHCPEVWCEGKLPALWKGSWTTGRASLRTGCSPVSPMAQRARSCGVGDAREGRLGAQLLWALWLVPSPQSPPGGCAHSPPGSLRRARPSGDNCLSGCRHSFEAHHPPGWTGRRPQGWRNGACFWPYRVGPENGLLCRGLLWGCRMQGTSRSTCQALAPTPCLLLASASSEQVAKGQGTHPPTAGTSGSDISWIWRSVLGNGWVWGQCWGPCIGLGPDRPVLGSPHCQGNPRVCFLLLCLTSERRLGREPPSLTIQGRGFPQARGERGDRDRSQTGLSRSHSLW